MPPFAVRLLCLLVVACASPAAALTPLPATQCGAPAPAEGATFSGPVLLVIDGERLCVAWGPTPDQWLAVRPAGIMPAAERSESIGRSALMAATFAKRLDCVAGPIVDGAVSAVCTLQGAPLTEEIRAAAARPASKLWR